MFSSSIAIGPAGEDAARIEQSLATLRDGLGQGFITDDSFLRYAAPRETQPFRSALAATDSATGRVVGVLLIEIVDAQAISASFLQHDALVSQDAELRQLPPGETGLIKSIAVSSTSRGQGVATRLVERGMRALAAHGARRYYSLAWVSQQQGCALCGVLTGLGFRQARQIERFWYDDSLAHNYLCPACGRPCECAARVMVR